MNTAKLRNDISKKLDKWNERSCFTIAGVKNLSKSDIDTIKIFCEYYDVHGNLNGFFISHEIKSVLCKYGYENN